LKNIKFTNTLGIAYLENPKLASEFIPEWYKETPSYIGGKKRPDGFGRTTATIKRCMPVFDAITAGYIISTYVDVYVSIQYDDNGNKIQTFEYPSLIPIEMHPFIQGEFHPSGKENLPYPKWVNPWSIKTPKGYSTMFVQPFHRASVFTILPGIVDTDEHEIAISFPFVINDPNFEGLIPKGTPIAQVIPFKRDSWKRTFGDNKDVEYINNKLQKHKTTFFDAYKKTFWHKKEYK
jgi:hypothetical protein